MRNSILSLCALLISFVALGLNLKSRGSFKQAVTKVVEEREKAYCTQLAGSLNQTRELMGLPAVLPNNFAEVLNAYFASMAAVMGQGVTNKLESEKEKMK